MAAKSNYFFLVSQQSPKRYIRRGSSVFYPQHLHYNLILDCEAVADILIIIRGNLARPWRMRDRPSWELSQILSILIQCLRGLASLHASPDPVIHRDIKPENILVEYREPLIEPREPGPWIKLADFGLATQGSTCEGPAGTWKYAAPEVILGQAYDSKIDIWSLGVVIMQLLLTGDIPLLTSGCMQGLQWCQDIIAVAEQNHKRCLEYDDLHLGIDGNSMETTLWAFIALFMLKWKSKDRKSAQQCLDSPILRGMQEYERVLAKGAPNSAR